MIEQKGLSDQLPNEIQSAFNELQIIRHLRNAGFKKKFGYTCSYLFQLVFVLVFYHKNWFQLRESNKGESFPGKDAVYRFLNHYSYARRRFLSFLSSTTVAKIHDISKKEAVFVVDDFLFASNRHVYYSLKNLFFPLFLLKFVNTGWYGSEQRKPYARSYLQI